MKKIILSVIFVLAVFLNVNAQNTENPAKSVQDFSSAKNSFSVQILKLGLSVDYERLIYKNFGMALSGGISGAELELKYHLKPRIDSPSIGFAAGRTWYDFDDLTSGDVTWENSGLYMFFFEYRIPKNLVFSAGVGWFDYNNDARVRFRGSIGFYFPW